jgi:hypothetical protein
VPKTAQENCCSDTGRRLPRSVRTGRKAQSQHSRLHRAAITKETDMSYPDKETWRHTDTSLPWGLLWRLIIVGLIALMFLIIFGPPPYMETDFDHIWQTTGAYLWSLVSQIAIVGIVLTTYFWQSQDTVVRRRLLIAGVLITLVLLICNIPGQYVPLYR